MSGIPSARMVEAMKLVMAGISRYQACKRVGIATNTMYRSRLNAMWLEAKKVELVDTARYNQLIRDLHRELDVTRPIPRVKDKKKQRFAPKVE